MTEREKKEALAALETRAASAEARGLRRTARSWRDYAANVAARSAGEIVLGRAGWTDGDA